MVDKYIKINGVGIEHNENIDEYFVTNEVMIKMVMVIVTNIIQEIIDDENLYCKII